MLDTLHLRQMTSHCMSKKQFAPAGMRNHYGSVITHILCVAVRYYSSDFVAHEPSSLTSRTAHHILKECSGEIALELYVPNSSQLGTRSHLSHAMPVVQHDDND